MNPRNYFSELKNLNLQGFNILQNVSLYRSSIALNIVVLSSLDDAAKKARQYLSEGSFGVDALRKATQTFAKYASLRTPPNAGSDHPYKNQSDFEKIFYRPILFLPSLVAGKIDYFKSTADDVNALKNGFKYKVVDTRTMKAFAYTKTSSEALEQARIVNRGLTRAAWGINLHQIGAADIRPITDLLKDSPNIADNAFVNQIEFDNFGEKKNVIVHNRSNGIKAGYKKFIANSVLKYAKKTLIAFGKPEAIKEVRKALKDAKKAILKAGLDYGLSDIYRAGTGQMLQPSDFMQSIAGFMEAGQAEAISIYDTAKSANEGITESVTNRFNLDLSNGRFDFQLR